jgi:hypothetical protein
VRAAAQLGWGGGWKGGQGAGQYVSRAADSGPGLAGGAVP